MAKSNQARGRELDLAVLRTVHEHGHIRAQELAPFVFSAEHKHVLKLAQAQSAKLRKAGLLVGRQLPDGAGLALVLSEAGAAELRRHGIAASAGTSWGRSEGGIWSPPGNWRHDILASGVLARWHVDGWRVIPEPELRRLDPGRQKYPDGLAVDHQENVWWLEVEYARKSGENMRRLAHYLAKARTTGVPIAGMTATHPLLVYAAGTRDERGYVIDHKGRLLRALSEIATIDLSLLIVEFDLSGHSLGEGRDDVLNVEANVISRHVGRMKQFGWRSIADGKTDERECFMAGARAQYWRNGGHWQASFAFQGETQHSTLFGTAAKAKRWLAGIWAEATGGTQA